MTRDFDASNLHCIETLLTFSPLIPTPLEVQFLRAISTSRYGEWRALGRRGAALPAFLVEEIATTILSVGAVTFE